MLMNLLLFILKAIITLDTSGRDVLECDVCFMCNYLWNREKNNYYCTFCFIWIHIYSAKLIIPRWLPFQPFFLFLLLQLTYALLPAIRKKKKRTKSNYTPCKVHPHTHIHTHIWRVISHYHSPDSAASGCCNRRRWREREQESELQREWARGRTRTGREPEPALKR